MKNIEIHIKSPKLLSLSVFVLLFSPLVSKSESLQMEVVGTWVLLGSEFKNSIEFQNNENKYCKSVIDYGEITPRRTGIRYHIYEGEWKIVDDKIHTSMIRTHPRRNPDVVEHSVYILPDTGILTQLEPFKNNYKKVGNK